MVHWHLGHAARLGRRIFALGVVMLSLHGDTDRAEAQWWSGTKQPVPQKPMQRPHPAVVRVIAPEGNATSYGSGTLVEVNEQYGLVVTNWHVVRDAGEGLVVVFPDRFQSTARVLKVDKVWDLAALLIHRPTTTPVELATTAAQQGEVLTIAGYGSGVYRAASGRVTQYVSPGESQPFEMVEVGVAARHGDSGGPMLNARGELAGVLFGEGRGKTSGSYAGRVRQFLQPVRLGHQLPEQIAGSQPTVPRVAEQTTASSWPRRQGEWQRQPRRDTLPQPANPINRANTPPRHAIAASDGEYSGRSESERRMAVRSAAPRPQAASDDRATSLPAGPVASTIGGEAISLDELLGDTPLDQLKTFLAIVGAFTLVVVVMRVLVPG